MTDLFSYSFHPDQLFETLTDIIPSLPEVDRMIAGAAPEWPIEKIARIDLAILRLSVWELCIERQTPPKVVIDEAVELAKQYGNEQSSKFINGVLGTLLKGFEKEG